MLRGDDQDIYLVVDDFGHGRQRLLARRPEGIFLDGFEPGEIGPDLFRKACEFGLEGIVSKHKDRGYRAGVSPNRVKVKNPKHPAITRVKEAFK